MSPENEPLRRVPAPAPELEAGGEVDFGRYARIVLGKWWLLLLGVLVGGALGFLYGQGGGSAYEAQATVYLGQPLSPSGSPVPSVAADPTGVATVAKSQSVIGEVAREVGIPAGKLRRNTTSSVLGERTRQTTNVALIGITVRGSDPEKVEQAANMIAERVVAVSSAYAETKLERLQERVDGLQTQLDSATERLDQVVASIDAESGTPTEQLLKTNLLATLEQQRADLTDRLDDAEELLTAAEEVERGRVVSPAESAKVDARNARTSAVVGAFLGLVLAALAALLWGSVARRRTA